ncbi:MAG: TonB-dependent receptor [Blastocatellia bacterium]
MASTQVFPSLLRGFAARCAEGLPAFRAAFAFLPGYAPAVRGSREFISPLHTAFSFLFLFAAITIIHAQSPAITGRVTDNRGDAIGGAVVDLTGTVARRKQTDGNGRFTIAAPPGNYELRVTTAGFSAFKQQVKLSDAPVQLDIRLEAATIREVMTVTPARAELRLQDAPASVSVFDAEDVGNGAAQTLDDLLRQAPGFSIFRRSSSIVANPTTQGVSLRGAGASGASRTLVLTDGVPLNDAFGGWVYWDRVPRAAVDRIELVRGGASDLYGSDALSGVINLISRQPRQSVVSAEASYGARDTSDVTFFASHRRRGFGASISGEAFHSDGYFLLAPDLRGTADEEAGSKHRALALRLSQEWNNRNLIFVRGALFDEDRRNGTQLQRNNTATESLAAGAQFRTGDGSNWGLTLFGNQQRFHQSFTAVAANRNSETLTRLQFVPSRDAGVSLNWSRLSFEKHLLVAGVDVRGVRGTSDEIVYVAGRPTTFVSAGGRQRRAGFFAQGIFNLTERLSLTVSGRYDNWRNSAGASVERTLATGALRPRFFTPRTEEAFSPRLALAFKANSRAVLRAAAYRAFRAPTLNELYRSFRVGDTLTQANERLSAERLTGGEAGVTIASSDQINTRITAYWTETKDPISNFTLSATPALITRERRNLGRTRSRGLEIESDFDLARHWRITAGYLFADATVRRAPQDVRLEGLWAPQVPRHQFTLQTAYSHPRYATAAIQFRATGRQFDDDQNRLPLGSFAVIDATVARPLGRYFEVFVAVQNLLDERFAVGRTPLETLGMPRMLRGGVRLRFE